MFLQQFSDGNFVGGKWLLAGRFPIVLFTNLCKALRLYVVADRGVSCVFAGHERTARSSDGRAGVKLGEAHSLLGERVDVGRLDNLLAVTAEFAIAEVIGND